MYPQFIMGHAILICLSAEFRTNSLDEQAGFNKMFPRYSSVMDTFGISVANCSLLHSKIEEKKNSTYNMEDFQCSQQIQIGKYFQPVIVLLISECILKKFNDEENEITKKICNKKKIGSLVCQQQLNDSNSLYE